MRRAGRGHRLDAMIRSLAVVLIATTACALLWWVLNDEDGGRARSVKGRVVVPVAVGGTFCRDGRQAQQQRAPLERKATDTTAAEDLLYSTSYQKARLDQAVREVEAHGTRHVVIDDLQWIADTAPTAKLAELKRQGAVEVAWRLPENPSIPLVLQAAADSHGIMEPVRSLAPYSVAVVEDAYLLVYEPHRFPEPSATIPILCTPAERGVSAWNGAGHNAAGVWAGLEANPDTRVVSVKELMEVVRPRPADMAHPPLADITHEGEVRRSALVESASYLLTAADIMLATYEPTAAAGEPRGRYAGGGDTGGDDEASPLGDGGGGNPESLGVAEEEEGGRSRGSTADAARTRPPTAATPFQEVQATLALLREKISRTTDDAYDVITALSTPPSFAGACDGALPFSFLPPVPNPAQQYVPTETVAVPLPALPHTLELLVVNPSQEGVDGGGQFYFSVATDTEVLLSATIPNGVCEVVDGSVDGGAEGDGDSDSDSSDGAHGVVDDNDDEAARGWDARRENEGTEDGSGSGSEDDDDDDDEGGNTGSLRHNVVCLVSSFEAMESRMIPVKFARVTQHAEGHGYANTVDEAALKSAEAVTGAHRVAGAVGAQMANLCAQVKHVGGSRFWLTLNGQTHDVEFTLTRTARGGGQGQGGADGDNADAPPRRGRVDPPGVARGVLLTCIACCVAGALADYYRVSFERVLKAAVHREKRWDDGDAAGDSPGSACASVVPDVLTRTLARTAPGHSRAVGIVCWCLPTALCVLLAAGSPFPLAERDVYAGYLLPGVALGGALGGRPAVVGLAGGFAFHPLALLLWGGQWAPPAWTHVPFPVLPNPDGSQPMMTLALEEGRVADELTLTYPEGATTTITLWHGAVCRVEVEHYIDPGVAGYPNSATVDIRTTLHAKGGAAVRHGGEPVRYRPHASRQDNTVLAAGAVTVASRDAPKMPSAGDKVRGGGDEAAGAALTLRFEPAMYVSVLPEGHDLHMDTTLHPQEGYAMIVTAAATDGDGTTANAADGENGGEGGRPRLAFPTAAETVAHLLVVLPAGSKAGWDGPDVARTVALGAAAQRWKVLAGGGNGEAASSSSSSLFVPDVSTLRPPAPLRLVRVREHDTAHQGALLLTYKNPSRHPVPVTLPKLCPLPRCVGMHLYASDHFGHVRCSDTALHFANQASAKAYTTFLLSRAGDLCDGVDTGK